MQCQGGGFGLQRQVQGAEGDATNWGQRVARGKGHGMAGVERCRDLGRACPASGCAKHFELSHLSTAVQSTRAPEHRLQAPNHLPAPAPTITTTTTTTATHARGSQLSHPFPPAAATPRRPDHTPALPCPALPYLPVPVPPPNVQVRQHHGRAIAPLPPPPSPLLPPPRPAHHQLTRPRRRLPTPQFPCCHRPLHSPHPAEDGRQPPSRPPVNRHGRSPKRRAVPDCRAHRRAQARRRHLEAECNPPPQHDSSGLGRRAHTR